MTNGRRSALRQEARGGETPFGCLSLFVQLLGRAALLSAPVDDDATIEPTHGRRACLIISTLRDRSNVIRGDPWRRRPFFDALSQVAHGSPRIFRLVGSWESGDYIERGDGRRQGRRGIDSGALRMQRIGSPLRGTRRRFARPY